MTIGGTGALPWWHCSAGRAAGSPAARAVDTITAGAVGSGSTTIWPIYIGIQNGFFDAVGIKIDPVFAPSSTAIAQQVAGGSTNLTVGSGIVDPIRAIEKGAPIAIWRIDMQAPPYALLAKPAIKSIKDLTGKTISIGGAKDITRIFVERMLVPNGVKPSEVDYVFAGATSARLSALQSGAVDAAILTSPQNFMPRPRASPISAGPSNTPGAAVLRGGQSRLGRGQQAGGPLHRRLQQGVNWFQDRNNAPLR
jgi:ABC-type nitrate/sulfonate/bicarbonate transport system substrate-binding protein